MYLIPDPKKIDIMEGEFVVSYKSFICIDKSCTFQITNQALLFAKSLKKALGYPLEITRGSSKKGDILFIQSNDMQSESYRIDIEEDIVTVTGSETGLWYAMQTLLQIAEQEGGVFPCLIIEDEPEIPNRGYYFDATRGRVPTLEWLKALADRLAYYKLNQLQLYIEHTYLFRDLPELWRDDTPLTAAEIMEFDKYCVERGIELVPSLSTFGHMYKLLSSKRFSHLSEVEDSDKLHFSLRGRMHHHTIDASNPESITLVKGMIEEFMDLFTSRQFNICADETFDLGRGRGKDAADKIGKDRLYINYVKELCEFVMERGRRPMFWGDVILEFPDLINELPKETICLNWGYLWNQREYETEKMHEAGAIQYCCPGCCGWNQWVTLNWNAYNNIKRLCTYAKKYNAIGVLNTDWGDFLHINHPDFSRAGMIYGAAFSWNTNIPEYEEINRRISRLEYYDKTERFLEIVAGIQENVGFIWDSACKYFEIRDGVVEYLEAHKEYIKENLNQMEDVDGKNERLRKIQKEMYAYLKEIGHGKKEDIYPYLVAVEGMILFNELGKCVASKDFEMEFSTMPNKPELAKELEQWFYHYKNIYRSVSKEGELRRIQNIVCFYGDFLRE